MPEGDILRRTAAALDDALAGRALERAELRWPSVATVDLVGRTVLGTRPYGKHLLTRLDDGRTLHTHLRMDGEWRVTRSDVGAPLRDHRVRAVLGAAGHVAVGRLLGMLDVVATRDEHTLVGHLGPDVLDDTFVDDGAATGLPPGRAGAVGIDAPGSPGPAALYGLPPREGLATANLADPPGAARSPEAARRPGVDEAVSRLVAHGGRPLAETLLDQRVVAGIGTIFTSESLFVERLSPWTAAGAVRDPRRLLLTARRLMSEAVRLGYPRTRVHMKDGRPCVRCGATIRRTLVRQPPEQRPIWWCPRCQPTPAA